MKSNEKSFYLAIHRESVDRINIATGETNIEYKYRFLLDGEDCGEKKVDGASRQHLLKEYFLIIKDLEEGQVVSLGGDKSLGKRLKQLGENMYSLLIPDLLKFKLFGKILEGRLTLNTDRFIY